MHALRGKEMPAIGGSVRGVGMKEQRPSCVKGMTSVTVMKAGTRVLYFCGIHRPYLLIRYKNENFKVMLLENGSEFQQASGSNFSHHKELYTINTHTKKTVLSLPNMGKYGRRPTFDGTMLPNMACGSMQLKSGGQTT